MTNLLSTRTRIILTVAASFLLLFALALVLLTDFDSRQTIRILGVALLPVVMCGIGAEWYMRRAGDAVQSTATLLNRITAGDLAFRNEDISRAAISHRLVSAIRALVLNLEGTIRRFQQLANDVHGVGNQVNTRTRLLSKSAQNQVASIEATTRSVRQIDQSINTVQKSMESLSVNAEETATSVLQMSASIAEVGRIGDQLSEFIEQTASAIEEMIASINEVATNTESFSSFAIQTASSMVEMNATTQEIGRSARQSSELARDVTGATNEGREAVRGTVEGMRKIQHAVDEAKSALTQLAERSHEIGEIVRVIDEIAGQTNLLALNAAIIAAQAGERGKGFAVVADEIRDLSERTSVSTEEIRTLIQNVQRGVERAAEQMTLSSERVHDGVTLTARAEKVLAKILDLTERSLQSISEIARATEEQTRGSQAATHAIEEVTKMVQQTATATQQQSQTSRKIGEQAAVVRDYTKHLKRAMGEQESGSRAIARAIESIRGSVGEVLESTSILATESSAIVKSMGVIEQATRESNFIVSDLNQMSNTLNHESSLLSQEIQRFQLPSPERGGSIRTATVLPHKLTLDPLFCQFMALNFVQKPVHETLVQFGEGAELVPGLAERWEVADHGTLYRFQLRRDVKFHNGRPVTARDVRESFHRLMSPELNSAGKWILRSVRGAHDVMEGRARTASGLRVVDDHTIEIVLNEPLAFFLLLLSMPESAIIPVEEARDPERFRLHPVGAGAFTVVEAVDNRGVKVRRNPQYYEQSRPHIDEIYFHLDFKSAKDVADAFLRDELDIAHGVPLSIVNEVRKDPERAPYLLDTIQLHTSYLTYDCSSPPFDRVEVRQAINHAVDKERINQRIFSGLGAIAQTLLPPGMLGYDPNRRGYQHDPERARALLRTAGYPDGFTVEYWRWDTDEFYNSDQIPMIIEDLEKVGIKVKVSTHSPTDVRAHRTKKGHNTIFAGNWYADFPDSDNFFFIFFHSESQAVPGIFFRTGELDKTIEEARQTTDIDRRTEIYRQLIDITLREAPLVTLFHDRFFVMYRPEVRGLRTYLVPPPVRYHDVWIER